MTCRSGALFAAVVLSSCELFAPKPMELPSEPRPPSPRLAPGTLPFALADDLTITEGAVEALNFGRRNEVGPLVATSLFFAKKDLSKQVQSSLVAVAALKDRVVVVFPASPDGVMTIAQGGLDRPWTAQPLDVASPLLRPSVGALDAVIAPDGSVVIAVRVRPFALRLYRWTTDGTVTREDLAPTERPVEHWSTSRCPDVRLDATAKGGVALAYLGDRRAVLMWKKPNAADWTTHRTPPLEYDDTVPFDMGCTNRVQFDASGLPQLLTLVRTYDRFLGAPTPYDPLQSGPVAGNEPEFHPRGLVGRAPPETAAHGYVMRADGLLSRGFNVGVIPPEASIDVEHTWHVGSLAFERHPGGYLVSGSNFAWTGGSKATQRFRASGPAIEPAAFPPEFKIELPVDSITIEVPGGGMTQVPVLDGLDPFLAAEHLSVEPCGSFKAWNTLGDLRQLTQGFTRNSTTPCLASPIAPVMNDATTTTFNQTPAFAHGERPYDVGVCTAQSTLVICLGGYEADTRTYQDDATAPRLVSVTPAAGEVPVTQTEVRFTLSRAPAEGERVIAIVSRVDQVEGEQQTPTVGGADVTVTLPTLVAGATYRVAVWVTPAAGDSWWLYLDGEAPTAVFTTPKSASTLDTRVSPQPFRCDGAVVNGICELSSRLRGQAGNYDDVGVGYDVAARPLGVPSVYDAQGNRVTDAAGQVMPTGQTRFTWGSDLARNARYEVRFPPGIVTFEGTEWFPQDLTLAFYTRP